MFCISKFLTFPLCCSKTSGIEMRPSSLCALSGVVRRTMKKNLSTSYSAQFTAPGCDPVPRYLRNNPAGIWCLDIRPESGIVLTQRMD